MQAVYILSAVRTPIGKFGGALASCTAADIGVVAAMAAMERAGVRPEQIEETIFGNARQAGGGPNPARQISVRSGVPQEVPAFTVKRVTDLTHAEYMEHYKRFDARTLHAYYELIQIFKGINKKQRQEVLDNLPEATGVKALDDPGERLLPARQLVDGRGRSPHGSTPSTSKSTGSPV